MKIITWNCCLPPWSYTRRKRLPGIVSNLVNTEADIICLQEIFFKKDANFIISKLKEAGFPHSFYFKDLLTVSKFSLTKKQGFIFKNQGNFFSWAILDTLYKKGFQLIELKGDKEKFYLINTHLLSAYAFNEPKYQITREKQVEEIHQKIDSNYTEVIFLGDLNFEPSTSPYHKVIKCNFIDPVDDNIKTVKNRKLDYILLKNISCVNTEVLFTSNDLSDHAALLISF